MNLRENIANLFGASASLLGAITANQEQFDYWFRQFGTFVAVAVGLATLWNIFLRKPKAKKEGADA